jgi:hypothetical protein
MSGYYPALYSTGEEKIHEEKTQAWRGKQRQASEPSQGEAMSVLPTDSFDSVPD